MRKNIALLLLVIMSMWLTAAAGQARETIQVNVGAGDQLAQIPINTWYRTSLFETIYYYSELNVSGPITALRFYNNFTTAMPPLATVIWLGETQQQDLSGGWIPSSQLTQVFSGNVSFPTGINEITITLDTPFSYNGGNLALLVFRPWEDDYYMGQDLFYAQTVGNSRSLTTFNNNTSINPDNPPVTGVTGQFPKTSFFVNVDGTGALTGLVTAQGNPLSGASVSLTGTGFSTLTGPNGLYAFPYLPPGTYQAVASKLGYAPQTQTVTVVSGQTTTQNFNLTHLTQVFVTGRIVGSDAPNTGLGGATLSLSGYADYTATADAGGFIVIPDVYANQTYSYIASAPGYQAASGEINVLNTDFDMGDIIVNEIAYAPQNVVARESVSGNTVELTWDAPIVAQEGWIHYDNGENFNSFGTAGSLSFDVAIRFPPDALAPYAGTSLRAVKIWPAMGGNFAVRVWVGGTSTEPGTMVVSQPVIPVLNTYNTVLLNDPIPVTGTEELWFGFLCDVTGVNPAYAGVDPGPAVNGFGNMIHWQGNWTTLLAVNSYCDFNWNIQGYLGLTPPAEAPAPTPLPSLAFAGMDLRTGDHNGGSDPQRIVAYRLWRLLQGTANNEASWVLLNPTPIVATEFEDTNWYALPDGNYLWAVKAIYEGGTQSSPSFSNVLAKVTQVGTLAGVVRNLQNAPIMGVTISCGTQTATTNSTGAYTLLVAAGVYSVTASHPDYQSVTQNGVAIITGQTTTLNFQLPYGSEEEDAASPELVTALLGNYPNPASQTIISFDLKTPAEVRLDIFNVKGQLVETLVDKIMPSGKHEVLWDGRNDDGKPLPSGIYYYRMRAGDYQAKRRMLLIK